MSKGYVYAARAPGDRDVKIGMTEGTPEKRLHALNNTSVVNNFELEFSLLVRAPRDVEKAAHKILADCRVRPDREFFRCSPSKARSAIKRAEAEVRRSNPGFMTLGIVNPVRRFVQQLLGTALAIVGVFVTALLIFLFYVDPVARGEYFNLMLGFLIVSLMILWSGVSLLRR